MKIKDSYIIFGTICWLISLVSFSNGFSRSLKLLSFFILISVATEWTAWYLVRKLHLTSLWLYNLYNIVEFIFLPYLYYHHFDSKTLKKIIKYFIAAFPVISVINILFVQGLHTFNTYTYLAGNLFMIYLIVTFFRETIRMPTYSKLTRNPMFFVSCGYLLFFTIEIPYTLLLPYFMHRDLQLALYFIWIIKVLNIILYLFLSAAYLCKLVTRK